MAFLECSLFICSKQHYNYTYDELKSNFKIVSFVQFQQEKNNFHTVHVHVLVGDILQIYTYVLFTIILSRHYPEV